MKGIIVYILPLLILVQCQSPIAERISTLDAEMIARINYQLSSQSLVHRVLMNKINISCQTKSKEVNQGLTREEYLTLLRDEHFMVLPQEMQQQKEALDGIAQLLEQDSINRMIELNPDLSIPFPNTYGSTWINIDKKALLENRKQGQAVLELFKEEKIIDEDEYDKISEAIEKSSILLPYQLYDLILKGLKK